MKLDRYLLGIILGGLGAAASACNSGHECGEGTTEVDGVCVATGAGQCGPGTVEQDGECVPDGSVICETGTTYDAETGTCVPDITGCAEGTVLVEGQCVPEDEAREADIEEPAEPNDALLESDGFGEFDMPAAGEAITIHGCVNPYRDINGDGQPDTDYDAYVFEAAEPTVIDLTVDGVNGLTGGFEAISVDPVLSDAGWFRLGLNLVGDTTEQQILLPRPGIYVLFITDGRSVNGGPAAGGPDACYFATVANVGIPAPTPIADAPAQGVLGGDVQVYSFDPASDGTAIQTVLTYTSQTAAAAVTHLVNGEYRGAINASFFGESPIDPLLLGLGADDEVLVIVEPVINYSLTDVATTLTVVDLHALPEPGDGTPVTITDPGNYQLLYFEGTAGDLVRFQFDPNGANYDVLLFPPGATSIDFFDFQFISEICFLCGPQDVWVQLTETGFYTLAVDNIDVAPGSTYDIAFTRTAVTPTALTVGTPAPGSLTSTANRAFFEADLSNEIWVGATLANASNITTARVRLYQRDVAGELEEFVTAIQDAETPFGQILYGNNLGTVLVSVEDADALDGNETFDFSLAQRDFIDAGTLSAGSMLSLTDVAVGAGESQLIFARTSAGTVAAATFTVEEAGRDLVVELLDRNEQVVTTINSGGAGAPETLVGLIADNFVAVRLSEVGGNAFTVDADATTLDITATQTSSPGLPFDDNVPVSDTVTFTETCPVAAITVDVDISHTWRGDVRISLTSPAGTTVQLKTNDISDSDDDVIGNYPATLTPVGDLNAFIGENPAGSWRLDVSDAVPGDDGVLNSWGVNLYCL